MLTHVWMVFGKKQGLVAQDISHQRVIVLGTIRIDRELRNAGGLVSSPEDSDVGMGGICSLVEMYGSTGTD